jgi:hypothetical protein
MTDQELQVKVAEICGWKKVLRSIDQNHVFKNWVFIEDLPPFTSSIDAIRAEVLKQGDEFKKQFEYALMCASCSATKIVFIHQLEATDWCHCFLEAWEKLHL